MAGAHGDGAGRRSAAPVTSVPAEYPGSGLGRPFEGPGSVATFGRRLLALAIDWGIALLIARLVVHGHSSELAGGGALLPVLVLALMNWLLIGTVGATIGHRLAGLRVDRVGGGAPGPGRALLRAVLLCLVIPPLTLVFDADQRGLHDRLVDTVVVQR